MTSSKTSVILLEAISRKIHLIRGNKVMLDSDLAILYGVPTHRLNEQVHRNRKRFPKDFMFRLNDREHAALISQIAISKMGRGGRRNLPYAFTEQGVAMLSSVLNSDRAIKMNITIMRAFVQLRQMLATHRDLAEKLKELEKKYDKSFRIVFEALRQLVKPLPIKNNPVGFGSHQK